MLRDRGLALGLALELALGPEPGQELELVAARHCMLNAAGRGGLVAHAVRQGRVQRPTLISPNVFLSSLRCK